MTTRYFCVCVESALAILLVLIAFKQPSLGSRWFSAVEQVLARVALHRRMAVLLVMAAALLSRAVLLPIIGIPEPSIHDEFSYMLAGKTFALGRVTNEPHPMWIHFESVHILQQPTHMSMYQPAQGLLLAIGYKMAGMAWPAVWLSVILLSGAICWMLQGWLSARWALAGGLLFVLRWGTLSYWVNSYWGGALPALGGALVVGSLPRLFRRPKVGAALTFGLGLALLALSRPYEGLVLSTVSITLFAIWSVRRGFWPRVLKLRILIPLCVALGLTGCGMLYYNFRVTGKALKLPYVADREQYAMAPLFLWQGLRKAPMYHTSSLRRVYMAEVELYRKGRALSTGPLEFLRKLKDCWLFFVGPLLTVAPLIILRLKLYKKDERTGFFLVTAAVVLFSLIGEVWFYPHYAAPAMCVIVALLMESLRAVRQYSLRGKPVGLFLSRSIPLGCLLMTMLPVSAAVFHVPLSYWPLQWYGGSPDIVRPRYLTAALERYGKSLVIVRYGPSHPVGDEWVYNEPDIDKAAVIWAREMDPKQDKELIRYFRGRSIWLLEADKRPLALRPYFGPAERGNK